MRISTVNPFVFSRALDPSEAIPRKPETKDLLNGLTSGNNIVLYGPRRTGKTTLLRQLQVAAPRHGFQAVQIDLSDVLSEADVAVRLEQAFRGLTGAARRVVLRELGSLGFTTPAGGLSASRRDRGMEPLATIHALLDLPGRLAVDSGKAVLLILDEFQALTALTGMDGVFRSHLQHEQHVSCIFCGSEPSLLRALFEDRARPFFGQALPVEVPTLDFRATYDFLVDRFSATGKDCTDVATELLNVTDLHPQRLMLVAYFLWEHVGPHPATMQDLRISYDAAMRSTDPELRVLWDAMTVSERRVVAALASGLPPFGARAQELSGLRNPSSGQKPLRSLLGRGVVARGEDGSLRLVDPLFVRWVRRNGGARSQVFVLPQPDGRYHVFDGPSKALAHSSHVSLDEAEASAHQLARGAGGADVMVYDTDDPNDLPDWAI